MKASNCCHQMLRAPAVYRSALAPPTRPQFRTFALHASSIPHARFLSVPTILSPTFWASMIPKPFRSRSDQPKSREWNPATPYIILGLLVGSQAIQIIWLKQEQSRTLNKAEAKIGVLREVIERVQNGEDVAVEKLLGTGDAESEKAWTEVLKEVENEEVLFQSKKKRKALRQAAAAEEAASQIPEKTEIKETTGTESEMGKTKVESIGGVRFY